MDDYSKRIGEDIKEQEWNQNSFRVLDNQIIKAVLASVEKTARNKKEDGIYKKGSEPGRWNV
ncbi:hypothetical protein [Akkermansia muciniphila]|uniref:hypothetical protein n=1 Tax=Akkermansia muciniphila TaxID=239935 RepID=UPI000FE3AB9B|nr:hypothetical protein [Akkermansia muciniphila]